MLTHRLEISVGVQEDMPVVEAERPDDHIDCCAHRDGSLAQGSVVHSAGKRDRAPEQIREG